MSNKIKLNLDDLKIESFVTSNGAAPDGTVFAMANTICENTCNEVSDTCNGAMECQEVGFGHLSDDCMWTTDQNAPSCTGGGQGGTLGCTGGGGGETEETCPETPESCEGMICEPA